MDEELRPAPIKKRRLSFEELAHQRLTRHPEAGRLLIAKLNLYLRPRTRRRHGLDDLRTTPKMRALTGLDLQFGVAFPAVLLDLPDILYVQAKTHCRRFYPGYQRQPETCTTRGLSDVDPLGEEEEGEEGTLRCARCVEDADEAFCTECAGSLALGTTTENALSCRDGRSPCPTYFTRVFLSCVRDVRHLLLAPYNTLCRNPDLWCEACLEIVTDEDADGLRRANRETIKLLCLLNRVDFPPAEILRDADASFSATDYPNGSDLRDNAYWDESDLSALNNLWNPLVDADTYDSARKARLKAQDEKDRERRRGQRLGVREGLGPVTAARRLFFDPARVDAAAVPLAQQRVEGVFREGYIYDFTMDD